MNFQEFFQMKESPFGESPDVRFFYPSRTHREALQKACWAIEENKSFVVITGEVGSGKTMLSRMLHASYADEAHLAFIVNPLMDRRTLLQAICHDFGISPQDNPWEALSDWLLEQAGASKRNLLVIDEAQCLSFDCLELIRLLTNLETGNRKLLQVILIGHPELEQRLDSPELLQLQQRVFLNIRLGRLSRDETVSYVRHRIERSGGGNFVRFDEAAIREVYRISAGIPRIINKLCEGTLRFAALERVRHIDLRRVERLPFRDLGIRAPSRIRSLWKGAGLP